MPPFLLALIPTLVKAVLNLRETKNGITKAAPLIGDAVGVSLNPVNNKKALLATGVALLAAYGYKISPEWLGFATALWPYIAAYAAAFAIGKAPAK